MPPEITKTEPLNIVTGTKGDLSQVQVLLSSNDLPSSDLTPAHMENFLLQWHGDELVGCVGLELYGQSGLLRSLAVFVLHRNQGYGAHLVSQVEDLARRQGVESICLLTTTATAFFISHGYRTTNRRSAPAPLQESTEFQSLCPDSAVCMVKAL